MKKLLSLLLALALCLGMASPALAYDVDSILDPYYEFRGQDFVIRDGVLEKYIGDGGDVVIPDTVKSIRGFAFENCTNVTSVTLPSSLEEVGRTIFTGCENLQKIVFPTSGKMVEEWRDMESSEFCESLFLSRVETGRETI